MRAEKAFQQSEKEAIIQPSSQAIDSSQRFEHPTHTLDGLIPHSDVGIFQIKGGVERNLKTNQPSSNIYTT